MENNNDKSWISSVFEAVTNGFSSMLASIKKHGWRTAILTMLILILVWSVVLNPIRIGDMVEDAWKKKVIADKELVDKMTEESIVRRENANYFVTELMVNVMEKFKGVKRMILLEKHNGSSNLKGVDFLYSSCTYELVSDSIKHPQYLFDDLQKQTNLNLLGQNLIQTLKHRDYLYFDDIETQSSNHIRILRKLKNVGDSEAIIFSFKDNKHRPIIMLVISGEDLNVKEITSYINLYKKQIEELLID